MLAWVCENIGEPVEFGLREAPVPQPGPDEVQLAVRAAGMNFGERLLMSGGYQAKVAVPYTLGLECAGEVLSVGAAVTGVKPGDRVMAMMWDLAGGAMAEIAVTAQENVQRVPGPLSFEQAAAFPNNYYTAYIALKRRGQLREGETLVVHGASGALGVAAVQLGKCLGARVIATGRSDEKLKVVKGLGADEVINVREDLRTAIRDLTRGRGADVLLDPVGGDIFDASMRAIAPEGRILVLGATSGEYRAARANILLVKHISVVGVDASVHLRVSPHGRQDMADLHALAERGEIVPWVGSIFPFEKVDEAFEHVHGGRGVGKCIVTNPARAEPQPR